MPGVFNVLKIGGFLMKASCIFFALIFYIFSLQSSQQNNPLTQHQQQQQPQVQVIINAQTESGVHHQNDIGQNSQHTSQHSVNIENANKEQGTAKELKPTTSAVRYTIINGAKVYAANLVLYTPLMPFYLANRFIIYPLLAPEDEEIFASVSEEEAAKLAEEGKVKIPELIIFPVIFHTRKAIQGYIENKLNPKDETGS